MTSSREEIRTRRRPRRRRKPKIGRWLIAAAVLFGAIAFIGITDRNKSDAKLAAWTDDAGDPDREPGLAEEGHREPER